MEVCSVYYFKMSHLNIRRIPMYTNIIFIFEYIFYKPNTKALTKAVRGFSTSVSIMWPINGLEAIQSEIKKNHKNKK